MIKRQPGTRDALVIGLGLALAANAMLVLWLWSYALGQTKALASETRRVDGLEAALVECREGLSHGQ